MLLRNEKTMIEIEAPVTGTNFLRGSTVAVDVRWAETKPGLTLSPESQMKVPLASLVVKF